MIAPPVPQEPPRKRCVRRVLGWAAGLTLCLLLIMAAARFVLVRQMRLPRLTITQAGCVTAVSVTPDGRTVFSGEGPAYDEARFVQDKPRDVFVWSASDGHLLRRLPAFYWRSSGVTASPDGKSLLASGGTSQATHAMAPYQVVDWNWQSGQVQWHVPGDLPLSYSPDGRFVGCENGVYSSADGRLICRTSSHYAEDGQSAFTPDGKWYGLVGDISLDLKTHKERETSDFEGDKQYTYSTTRIHFWRTDTGRAAKDFPFTRVRAFDIARSGQWLVMTSDTGPMNGMDGSVVRRVDINTEKAVWTRERQTNGPDADLDSMLNSVVVSPNGKYIVLASINSHLIVLDAQTGRELFRPFIPPGATIPDWAMPGGLAFSADGKMLVSRCGRRVLVWDASRLQ